MFSRTAITAFFLLCICCKRNPPTEALSSGEQQTGTRKITTKTIHTESTRNRRISNQKERSSLIDFLEEKQIYSKFLDSKVSLEKLEKILELVDNGEFPEDEFEGILDSIFQEIQLPVLKELASIVGKRISSSSLPNSATVFSKILAKKYHERTDWRSGDVLENLVIPGPYNGLLIMAVGQRMVSGDQPTRAFFELLDSKFENRSKSDYGPLVRFSVAKLTSSDLGLIEQVPVNQYGDFGAMIVGAIAKKLVRNTPDEAVDYILNLPDSPNKEVAIFELAKLSVFFEDAETAGEWFAELKDQELQKAIEEFATQRGVKIPK